jgi:hypothetical protein
MRDPSQLPDQPIDPLGDPARLMSWPSLESATGIGRAQIYALMQLGEVSPAGPDGTPPSCLANCRRRGLARAARSRSQPWLISS